MGAGAADSLLIGAANGDPINNIKGVPGSWIMFDDIQLKSSAGATQNILNNSFENWTPLFWDEVDGWQSSNQRYIGEPLMPAVKTSDTHTGNFALELNTFVDFRGDTSWSQITNGTFGEGQMEGGVPFSGSPTAIEFYYKYAPVGNDTASFNIEFKKTGFSSQWGGAMIVNAASVYTLVSNLTPFLNSPDSVLITINGGRKPGTQLKVDAFSFIFPVGVSELVKVEKIVAYPNPVKDMLNLRFELKADKNVVVNLIDVTGKQLSTLDFGHLNQGVYNQTFNTANFGSGIYFIEFLIDGDKKVERFIVK